MATTAKIHIDPEFQLLCPALNEEEFNQLEKNIVRDKIIYEPLVLWGNTLIDGHNRYQIALNNRINYSVRVIDFASREEAKGWIIMNQLGRRNLKPKDASRLRGELYELAKNNVKLHKAAVVRQFNKNTTPMEGEGGGQFDHLEYPDDDETSNSSAKIVAVQTGVSERTVRRDAALLRDLKSLHPDLRNLYEGDMLKLSRRDLDLLAQYDHPSQIHFVQRIQSGECKTIAQAVKEEEVPAPETFVDRMESEAHAIRSWAHQARSLIKMLPDSEWLDQTARDSISMELKSAGAIAMHYIGVGACPRCKGKACKQCRYTGWLPKAMMEVIS